MIPAFPIWSQRIRKERVKVFFSFWLLAPSCDHTHTPTQTIDWAAGEMPSWDGWIGVFGEGDIRHIEQLLLFL